MVSDVLNEKMCNSFELDDLFETSESKFAKERIGETKEIKICDLKEFENHPFKVIENEDMEYLKQSIQENGILMPIVVRELSPNLYEILSGHRRTKACKLLGIETIPCLVRDFNDEQSTILMVDSNLQREVILPSEKAFAYKLKLNALKKQGKRTDLTCDQVEHKLKNKKSIDIVAENSNESRNQIQRYIRLTHLEKDLLDMVDDKVLPLNVGVELSYLNEEEQIMLLVKMEELTIIPTIAQATKIKSYSPELTEKLIDSILKETKTKPLQVTFKKDKLSKYFDKGESQEEIEKTIINLLENWRSS